MKAAWTWAAGTTVPPAYQRESPVKEVYIREVEEGRARPGGLISWGREHVKRTARILGVPVIDPPRKKATVLAVLAAVDRIRSSGGAGAGRSP